MSEQAKRKKPLYETKEFAIALVIAIGLAVAMAVAFKSGEDEHKVTTEDRAGDEQRRHEQTLRDQKAAEPQEREPVYETPKSFASTDKERAREDELAAVAMRAVYTRCSKFHVFREGSRLDATNVFRESKKTPDRVNVEVKLARPERASGHTLFYMVTFDKAGKAAIITPVKQISADMCDLGKADVASAL